MNDHASQEMTLAAGQDVLAVAEEQAQDGPVQSGRIARVFHNAPAEIWEVRLADRAGHEQVLRTTAGHPFCVAGKGWVAAKDLQAGDELRGQENQGSWLAVHAVTATGRSEPVFNVEVEGRHTYFVAAAAEGDAVLVHNISINWESRNSDALYRLADPRYKGPVPAYAGAASDAARDDFWATAGTDPELSRRMQTAKFAGGVALVAAGAATFYAGGGVMLAGGLGLLGGGMAVKPTGSGIIDRSLKSSLRDPGHPSTAEMAQ